MQTRCVKSEPRVAQVVEKGASNGSSHTAAICNTVTRFSRGACYVGACTRTPSTRHESNMPEKASVEAQSGVQSVPKCMAVVV